MPDFSSVEKLDLSGKRVVVSGGTQGIGAGVARLAARLRATVAIIGRNAALGKEVLASFPTGDTASLKNHVFISADLSTIGGAKHAAQKLKDWAGEGNIDLLFQTQGGPPSATEVITSDNLELHFAIQALSRFVLTYNLAKLGALRDSTVVMIAAAGQGADKIDFENFDLKGAGGWPKTHLSAAVIDCFTKEFNNLYPSFHVMHAFPGIVRTNVIFNSDAAWYIKILAHVLLNIPFASLVGMVSPEEYAKTAMWIATSKEVKDNMDVCCWTEKATEARMSMVAKDDELRKKVWDKLVILNDGTAAS